MGKETLMCERPAVIHINRRIDHIIDVYLWQNTYKKENTFTEFLIVLSKLFTEYQVTRALYP